MSQMKRGIIFAVVVLALCSAMVWAGAPESLPTPDQALERLQRGNERFVASKPIHPDLDPLRRSITAKEGQRPFAMVLGCSDSRVPVEHVFDAGLGDLFVIRVAGNVTYFDQAGTIEYGAEHLGANLLVVMGHTKCGAVAAVVNGAQEHGNIPALVANIVPAVNRARAENPGLSGPELVDKAVEANVWQSIEDLFKQSPAMREMVKAGKVKVVGAVYDIESGKVKWLGEHSRQAELVELAGGAS
jgi:carbonic anhydrase